MRSSAEWTSAAASSQSIAPHGEEAVRNRPERLAHAVAVREAGEDEGSEHGPGSSAWTKLSIALQSGVSSGEARSADGLEPIELVRVLAKRCAERGLGLLLRLAGQEPAVADDLAERGDDVPLLRGVDHRGRDRE